MRGLTPRPRGDPARHTRALCPGTSGESRPGPRSTEQPLPSCPPALCFGGRVSCCPRRDTAVSAQATQGQPRGHACPAVGDKAES